VVFSYENFSSGAQRIIWGLFKKVVVADNIAFVVDEIYGSPDSYGPVGLLLASYLFAIQIYCDFSGYSDIAIGSAKILGIDLMKNFRTPYWATSVREFWARWHISLSTWFRDYVYIPLGGNQKTRRRIAANILFVFIISGLWHGANWTFIIWGTIHGVLLLFERLLRRKEKPKSRLTKLFHSFILFQVITLAWIFFRAENLNDAWYILTKILGFDFDISSLMEFASIRGYGFYLLRILLAASFMMADPLMERLLHQQIIIPTYIKRPLFATIIAIILVFGYWGEVEFIYFQF
jgi:D-alanyl-lipoteichoic acid acyltransferase DltB (MBOAT superfamily)